MQLNDARAVALEIMGQHRILERGYSFRFDKAKTRFGLCDYTNKIISLSRQCVLANAEEAVRRCVLHEVAHALAGFKAGHGPEWQKICLAIGGDGKRCHNDNVAPPDFVGSCPRCSSTLGRYRLPTRAIACGKCCRKSNQSKFSIEFMLVWRDTKTNQIVETAQPFFEVNPVKINIPLPRVYRPFAPRPDEVEISGNTFPVKDALSRLKGRWNPERKAWAIQKSKAHFAWFIVEAQATDGKVKIILPDGKLAQLDFSKTIYCKCQEGLAASEKTDWKYCGERKFQHQCGKTFTVFTPNQLINADVYTTGYTGKHPADLKVLTERLSAIVVDVRFSPRSRHERWEKSALGNLLGDKYVHLPELGNTNYKAGGRITISNLAAGIEKLRALCFRQPVILMCACAKLDDCHRQILKQELQLKGYRVAELETWTFSETPVFD